MVDAENDESEKTQRLDGKDLQTRDAHEGDLDKAEQEISACNDIERRTLDGTNEEEKGQNDHIGKYLVKGEEQTYEDAALDGASVSEENIPDAKHQEHDKAEITEENGISDKEKEVNESSRTYSEINETHILPSESSEDDVSEVNEINAKSVHVGSAVLILEGIEEALVTLTAPMTETTYEDRNLDVSTLVLQATEVESVQCQEKDSRIIAAQQPNTK